MVSLKEVSFSDAANNNLSQTVLELFVKEIEKDGLWPSHIVCMWIMVWKMY